MDRIEIKIDEQTIREAQRILRAIPGGVERAFPRAINRVVDSAATDIKRRVGQILPVPLGEIAKAIAKVRASRSNWYGAIGGHYYRVPVSKYKGTRQTKQGVTFKSARTQARELIEGGFFATMKSSHRGVFVRASYTTGKEGTMMRNKNKEAIYQRRGPSVWKVITDREGLLATVMEKAGGGLQKQIDDQVGVELRRWAKR